MSTHTHHTAPTQYVEAAAFALATGVLERSARRRSSSISILPARWTTGTPIITDGLANDREVILFNNAGIASSSGQTPTTIGEMGAYAIAFIRAPRIGNCGYLGFSIGGTVAQEIVLQAPDLVRKLILVGTGPRGGESMASLTPEAQAIFGASYDPPSELWLSVHFTPSELSQHAARAFLSRMLRRVEERDPEAAEQVATAQIEALGKWGVQKDGAFDYLKQIRQPTLVVNGQKDVIIYTVNSFILQQHMPNAQLILYPDANHGSMYQYPELFLKHVAIFLDA